MSRKSRSETRLVAKTLPKVLVRAQIAGEIVANLSGNEDSTRIAQEGVASRSFCSVEVYGVDSAGHARDCVRFNVDRHDDANDHISVEADDSRSMIERVDGGYARGIAHAKARFERKGLRAETRYRFTDDINNDPVRKRAEQDRLGTYTCDPPQAAPGHTLKRVAKLTPGRDTGQSIEFFWGKKQRR